MNAFFLVLLAAGGVPDVTAGPELVEQAQLVEAPIEQVTVYSDRARVRRCASRSLAAGNHVLRLPDLPGSVLMDTVRVGCRGAKVIRIEAVPIERERYSIEQVEKLIVELEATTDKLAALDAEVQVHGLELAFLATIAPAAPVAESERVGKPQPPVMPDLWKKALDFLQARRDRVRKVLRDKAIERRKLVEELEKVQREVGRHDLGAFTDRKIQVLAIVQAKAAASARLELEYFVPGAAWWPSYDLNFDSGSRTVSLRTAGLVQQATGEDWKEVALELSTAIPGQGIELPELLTWALGEKREFVPHAVAARWPAQPPRFALPSPQPTAFEAERQARLQLIQQRLGELQNLISMSSADLSRRSSLGYLEGADIGGVGRGVGAAGYGTMSRSASEGKKRAGRYRPRPKRAPPPMKAPMPSTAEAMPPMAPMVLAPAPSADYEMGGETGAVLDETVALKSGEAMVRTTSLGLFEPTYYRRPTFSDQSLPAVVAGGLDYVYACPTAASVPSTGERLSVPLALDVYPAETFYEATPSLKKTAYLKAVVRNKGERPILGGPVNIFMGHDFAGQGRLATTGPKGELPLPLGADEDIRLKRTVVPSTEQQGVFSKDDVTTYTVTIEVGNYKRRAVKVTVIDQIPLSGNEDVEIDFPKKKMKPGADVGPDEDGIMKWKIDIPAGKTKKIEFAYRIKRPENWQLHQ